MRLTSCYLDWSDLVVEDPSMFSVTDSFFLCGGRLVLKAGAAGSAAGVYAVGNQFHNSYCAHTGDQSIVTDVSERPFTGVTDVTIAGNMVSAPTITNVGVRVTRTVSPDHPTNQFTVDFTGVLLFDVSDVPIRTIEYSLTVHGQPLVPHAARPAKGAVVTIETTQPVSGTVTVTVDQSLRSL